MNDDNNPQHTPTVNVLASLRSMAPQRPVSVAEAFRIAERQARRLLDLTGFSGCPVPDEVISEQPHIEIAYRADIPTSGLSYWSGHSWVICLNETEPTTRQRFTLLHEYKHIVDHRQQSAAREVTADVNVHAERLADYFAGCVLVPKLLLKRAWTDGIQQPADLGQLFEVSARAISVRLDQVGLTDPRPRCLSPSAVGDPQPHHFRRNSSSHCIPDLVQEATHAHVP